MPRGHRAGRKNQLRRLVREYASPQAKQTVLLGEINTPSIINIKSTIKGITIDCGDWAQQKPNSAPEISGISIAPIPWRLIES